MIIKAEDIYAPNTSNRIRSLSKHSTHSFMVCYGDKAYIFDVDTMNQIKTFDVNMKDGVHRIPLLYNNIVPDTNFEFMLEFHDP